MHQKWNTGFYQKDDRLSFLSSLLQGKRRKIPVHSEDEGRVTGLDTPPVWFDVSSDSLYKRSACRSNPRRLYTEKKRKVPSWASRTSDRRSSWSPRDVPFPRRDNRSPSRIRGRVSLDRGGVSRVPPSRGHRSRDGWGRSRGRVSWESCSARRKGRGRGFLRSDSPLSVWSRGTPVGSGHGNGLGPKGRLLGVLTSAYRLTVAPVGPGLSFHR